MATWLSLILYFQTIDEARALMESEKAKLLFQQVVEKPKPITVTWNKTQKTIPVENKQTTITERYLVSEPWCQYCPAAKRRFLGMGGKEENVITIAAALRDHGKRVTGIPYEFSVTKTVNSASTTYRSQWPMKSSLNGTHTPTKKDLLDHLRNGGPHQNKHWKSWNIESWTKEQLAALHDDDHDDKVPMLVSSAVEETVEVAIDSQPNFDYAIQVLGEHLLSQADDDFAYSSVFDFDVDVPDNIPSILNKLLADQKWSNSFLSVDWSGSRSINVTREKLSFSPSISVTAQKSILKFTTKLNAVAIKNEGKQLIFELSGAPDITINFR